MSGSSPLNSAAVQRHRASRRAWRILATAPIQEQRQRVEALLDAERGELTMTLERLRAAPTRRDLDNAALKLAKGWRRLLKGTPPPVEWQEHVFDAVPRAEIEAALDKVEMLVRPDDACHYEELRRRWRRIQPIFAALLGHVSFGASPAAEPVKKALDYLRALEENWSDAAMRDAPMGTVSRMWRRHVLDARGRVDPRAYVFAVLESFRAALKRREIFTAPSIRFADPRRGLLEGAAWAAARVTVCRTLGRSANLDAELADLKSRLDRAHRRVTTNLPGNPHLRFERHHGREELVLTGLNRLPEPESLRRLRAMVGERLPKVDLPDVLLEIAARTGFPGTFTHLGKQGAKTDGFMTSLCAVLVAEACNIGFEPLLQPEDPALGRARLS